MLDEESLKKFEKIAVLLQNNCFEEIEDQRLKANYEIRAMVIIELYGASQLCFGDESGTFWSYNLETNKEIYKKEHPGTIGIIDYRILPGNQTLLFVVVRYKGIFVYRIEVTENEIQCREEGIIFETKEYIHFFYPHIVIKPDNTIVRCEVWIGQDNGKFMVLENEGLNKKGWELKQQLDLPYTLRGCAVDLDPEIPQGKCNFFIGNSVGDIFCLEFNDMAQVSFPTSQEGLEKQRILSIHGALFEKMIPLSEYRKGATREYLFYKELSGCLAISGNNVICIYFKREKGRRDLHTRTKVFSDQLLDIKCLPFDDFCWTAISDNKKKLHFIKNVTDMTPPGESLEVIIDGEFISVEFEDRIFNILAIPASGEDDDYPNLRYRGYLGMGNNSVLPINIYDYEAKLNEARQLFDRIIAENAKIEIFEKEDIEPILLIIDIILDYFHSQSSRTAIKLLLLNLMKSMSKIFHILILSDAFSRFFYKTIDNERTDLIQKASGFLSRLEKPLPVFETAINEFHTHIKKYILDGASYSAKDENLKGLWEYNEKTGNLIDSIVYRGILYDRQYDPVAHIPFDKENDGEITRFVPIKPLENENFIIPTSKGKLFLADIKSKHKRLVLEYKKNQDSPDVVLKLNNLYVGKKYLFILPSAPIIIIKCIADMTSSPTVIEVKGQDECCLRIPNERNYGTIVCQMPWDEEKSDECFIGTNQGDIFFVNPTDHSVTKAANGLPDQVAILDLRSFIAGGRYFIVAGCKNGKIKIYECFHSSPPKLVLLNDIPVDTNAVTCLFVFFKEDINVQRYPLMVAGTDSGKCFGIRLVINQNPYVESFKYIYEWCYFLEKAVKEIHPFSLARGDNYILISSMDSQTHILEWDGICVSTIRMRLPLLRVYVDIFREKFNEDPEYFYRNAYATTMDNHLRKIRFFIQKELIKEINACFLGNRKGYEKFNEKDQEVMLLKFKTIDILEPHFRTRYYLKSKEFNSANRILEEIEQILDRGKTVEDSDALVALTHHLFTGFFDEIIKNREIFKKVKTLFVKTRDHWGYPGLIANTRAQLYWIRSMLKGCCKSRNMSPVEMLNQWFNKGTEVAGESGLHEVSSGEFIKHFITHPVPFIRVKTLQYFQRFVFNYEDENNYLEKTVFSGALVTALSQSVFSVLNMHKLETGVGSPSWFEMEAVRFFTWMVLNYKYTGLCPAQLCYDVWKNNIPSTFLFRLSDAIQIYQEDMENKIAIADMLQAAGKLMEEMKRENPQVIGSLPDLVLFCRGPGRGLHL